MHPSEMTLFLEKILAFWVKKVYAMGIQNLKQKG